MTKEFQQIILSGGGFEMRKRNQTKKCISTYSMDVSMRQELEEVSNRTGVKMGELNRRAMRQFLDGNCDETQVMLNFILLAQTIQDIKENIDQHEYERMEQYIENIMTIKGGNANGSI